MGVEHCTGIKILVTTEIKITCIVQIIKKQTKIDATNLLQYTLILQLETL